MPQHWKLISRIVRETNQRVIVPIYPLLPFGTAREARDGVVDLLRRELDSGHQVRLAGDSAGGQISLSAALHLRDEGTLLPDVTLLSPALDLTWKNPQIAAVQPLDPWLGRPGGRFLAQEWRGNDDIEAPVVSPLFGDMTGLGPLTILTGTRDSGLGTCSTLMPMCSEPRHAKPESQSHGTKKTVNSTSMHSYRRRQGTRGQATSWRACDRPRDVLARTQFTSTLLGYGYSDSRS